MLNGRLLTYLKRPETVQKLLGYLVGAPPSAPSAAGGPDRGGDGEEDAPAACVRTKHSVTACEVRCRHSAHLLPVPPCVALPLSGASDDV